VRPDGRSLQILHLEDDLNDQELVRAALEGEGYAVEVTLAMRRREFERALAPDAYDLVLSDFNLPDFDGLSALRLVQERSPNTPFILVSGTIGEEAAIQSLRAGATDYVLKNRLSALPPAVRRALAEADERCRRAEAEQELQREQRFLRAVLETIEAGIAACNERGTLTLFNRAARELHGRAAEPLPPERWAEHYDLCRADGKTRMSTEEIPLVQALGGASVRNAEMTIVPGDGRSRTILVSAEPLTDGASRRIGAVVAMQDITERKSLEEQLRQAQKMEAVGRLAGGVAHDFNNLLGVILGYAELQLADMRPDDPGRGRIEQIHRSAERGASLTRQLLAFSRKQILEPRELNVDALLHDMNKMLRRLIGEDIELVTRHGTAVWPVRADAGQIEQIVMNLVVNSRDAMPDGGTITIETANVDAECTLPPGEYVMIAVTDTGTGMSPEVRAQIFEPFFTTKDSGHGTGLGLSTVYGIVKQSGGHIVVDSEPGRGTRFEIFLPRIEEASAGAVEAAPSVSARAGGETVVVVDDEPMVREMLCESLREFGYRVLDAGEVGEALEVCRRHDGPIHLLLTDVVLPGMSGRELAERLAPERPEMKIVFMSGYTDDAIVRRGVLAAGVAFLQKPFTLVAMARKVRETLDDARVSSRSEASR